MKCTLADIKNKEVINIRTGKKLGYVDDIEFDCDELSLKKLIIYGSSKLFGFFGRDNDIIVNCNNINLIGEDTILISNEEAELTIISESSIKSLFN